MNMQCSYPRVFNGFLTPCRECMACRINKKRLWTHRIMLESYMHKENLFLTLTYAPEHLPQDGSVSPRALQLFLKRLRDLVKPTRFRFFAVGEYGDDTFRPHYHLALFGLGARDAELIQKAWPYGFIAIGDINTATSSYVAGYCTKKMTSATDPRLGDKHPEFTRMSNRPGIGVPALNVLLQYMSPDRMAGDVPRVLRHGDKYYPLGRLLRDKLRKALFSEEKINAIKAIQKEEMRIMRENSLSFEEVYKATEGLKDYLFELRSSNPNQEIKLKKRMSFWKKRKL